MMKPNDILTIEKLKSVIEKENAHTADCTTTNRRTQNHNIASSLFNCAYYLLEPLLPSDGKNSGGRIASVVYLICLTTAGIVMNMTTLLQQDNDVLGITAGHIDGFSITCIIPALIWIIYIFCKQSNRNTVDFISSAQNFHRPLLAGAYVFGTGSSVMDILHVSYYMQCSSNISGLIFSMLKSIFILTQILFLRKFANATLHTSQSIRLMIFHILGTNICLWFRALFRHADFIFRSGDVDPKQNALCKLRNESMMKIWATTEPYLYPFTMEFSLIAGGMLFTIWSSMRDLDPDPQDIYIYDEIHDNRSDIDEDRVCDSAKDHQKCHEYLTDRSSGYHGSTIVTTPPMSRSVSRMSLYSSPASNVSVCQSYHDTSHQIMDAYNPSSDPGLLIGVLFSILLFIFIAFVWIDKHSPHALKLYYIYQITLHAFIILALWMTLKALQFQTPFWFPYNSDDFLLILSFSGVFLYNSLSLTATISELGHYPDDSAAWSCIKSGIVLLESMLQVTAIVKAVRFQSSFSGSHADIVRQAALFLMVTNMALWVQDSFYELRYTATTPVQNKLFGENIWRGITIIAYPFCIFFRFHSGACLFEVWRRLK